MSERFLLCAWLGGLGAALLCALVSACCGGSACALACALAFALVAAVAGVAFSFAGGNR